MDIQKLAEYITWISNKEGEPVTHMQLQMILYYVQGVYLQGMEKEAYEEEIEAWDMGPVIEKVFNRYAKYGMGRIINTKESVLDIDEDERYVLDSLIREIRQTPPFDILEDIQHKESAYSRAYKKGKKKEIDKELLKYYA